MDTKIIKKITPFLKGYELVKYKKGQLIYKPSESSMVCLIKSGYTRTYLLSKEGQEITLPIIKSLFFSSLIPHITGEKNQYYFESISPIEMWQIPKDEFLTFIKEDKELFNEVVKSIITEFSFLTDSFQKIILGNAYIKIASLINSIANEAGKIKGNEVRISLNVPHRIMASMTGLTRETVTLQILKMQKDGYLKTKGRNIIIRDYKKFKKLLSDF